MNSTNLSQVAKLNSVYACIFSSCRVCDIIIFTKSLTLRSCGWAKFQVPQDVKLTIGFFPTMPIWWGNVELLAYVIPHPRLIDSPTYNVYSAAHHYLLSGKIELLSSVILSQHISPCAWIEHVKRDAGVLADCCGGDVCVRGVTCPWHLICFPGELAVCEEKNNMRCMLKGSKG